MKQPSDMATPRFECGQHATTRPQGAPLYIYEGTLV